MEHHQQLNCILLVLLTTITGTNAIITDSFFNMLQEGQLITGEIFADILAKSSKHCSIMCLSTEECKAYMYKGTGQENCFLIKRNSTATDGQLIEMNDINIIYQKNFCYSDQCQNGGECVITDDGYQCECVDGYIGNHCEEEDNCFNNNNCTKGATCVDGNDTYSCSCVPGYIGNHCEEEDNCYPSHDCAIGTKCVNGESSYTCICDQESDGTWTEPSSWSGPDAVLYRSFNNMDGLVLMEGTKQMDYAPLVSGQVNCAWTLNHTKNQWVDLGIRSEACMTQPETCGAAGGAISLWLKVIDCPYFAGVLSSVVFGRTGVRIYCLDNLVFRVNQPNGVFLADLSPPTGWTHIVLNYLGPNDGEGIRIYIDGAEVRNDTTKGGGPYSAGDGRIVVGRFFPDRDERYNSVQVDELVFFNQTLTLVDIIALNNSVSVLG